MSDAAAALDRLRAIEAARPLTAEEWMLRAGASRALGRGADALAAIDGALGVDPRHFLALLSKGATLASLGQPRAAARTYADALKLAPPSASTPPALAAPIARARAAVDDDRRAAHAHMALSVAAIDTGAEAERAVESLCIFAGLAAAPVQQPLLLQYPRLPAIPFHPREAFPWLERLEAATPVLQAELAAVMAADRDRFAPYIAFPPQAPVNQWAELNHSRDWSTLWLWRDGVRDDRTCARCPGTAALLASLPMLDQPGFGPTAMFSALAPRTAIPPHTGSANTRLIVHLPLILPGPAWFRVGNSRRDWRVGEAWVFDDTIEHEAMNEADETRVILIFDIWNPALTLPERAWVTAMMAARADYYAGA